MSAKKRSKGGGGAVDPDEVAARKAAEAAAAPLKQSAFAGLKSMRDALDSQAKAKAEAEKKSREAREARGELFAPAKKPAQPAPVRPAKKPGDDVWRPDVEKELFSVAMSGVKPLAGKGGANRVLPGGAPQGPRSLPAPGSVRDAGARHRKAQAEGDEAIEVRWSDEGACEGSRPGRAFALEALGRFAVVQDRLDLHGLEPGEARTRVEEFVRSRRARGARVVCVVHGSGRHAPDGASVLRDAAVRALAEPPGSREIDAFRTASPEHGGAGALLVALRAGSGGRQG